MPYRRITRIKLKLRESRTLAQPLHDKTEPFRLSPQHVPPPLVSRVWTSPQDLK